MTIKYNNKVIAGKYKEQVIPFANTIDAGIAKIATQEEINEGADNSSIVTPVYLAQKQDKLIAGDGININEANIISSKITPDKVTIIENESNTISTIGRKTVNENIIYDWEGTEAEYHQAIMNNEIDPSWYCYITDDEQSVSYNDVLSRTLVNIAPQGEEVIKNLSLENEKLDKSQITNCLLEVPQNINLEITDEGLVLKAGSTFILPNGANNFERVTITEDLKRATFGTTTSDMFIQIYRANSSGLDGLSYVRPDLVVCSDTQPEVGKMWYDLTNNKIYNVSSIDLELRSFPFAIVRLENGAPKEIKQVFNGFGYFGNTIFADKGIKGLIPNGRNVDGTLNNIEFETTEVLVSTRNMSGSGYLMLSGTNFHNSATAYYDENENKNFTGAGNILTNAIVGTWSTDSTGKFTEINVKQPFRAVDYNEYKTDISTLNNSIDTLNNTKVNKAGDTMTGNLTLVKHLGVCNIKSNEIDYTTTVPSNVVIGAYRQADKNNKILGDIRFERRTDGTQVTSILARNNMTGTEKSSVLSVAVDANGVTYTAVPTPATNDNSTKIATTAWVNTNSVKRSELAEVHVITQKYVSGTSWYRVWSDGWIEQGGQFSWADNGQKGPIVFLKPFSNTNYYVNASVFGTTADGADTTNIRDYTTTQFYISAYSSSRIIRWYACGY